MNEIAPINSNGNPYPIKVNEEELKKRVDPLSYAVLRKAATETAFTGEYTDSEVIGVYKCKACLLYTSPSPRDRTRSRMPSSA